MNKIILFGVGYWGKNHLRELSNNSDISSLVVVDPFIDNYNELLDLYEILENDDDIILKWYFNNTNVKIIKRNNVSNLLKKFKL